MRKSLIAGVALALLATAARAEVERLNITERTPFAGGQSFGATGAYEKLRGVAHIALDPQSPADRVIVDLDRAPRDADGKVRFDSEFVMLRPVSSAPSTLIYDVNNRGGIAILGQVNGKSPVNNDPTTAADAGDGFLMRHGFTLLWSAWTWDVAPGAPGSRPLVVKAPPIARGVTGQVENEIIVSAPAETVAYAGMRGLTYPPATPDDPQAVLTERTAPDGPRTPIPRARWRFAAPEEPGGPGRVTLQGGFQPGRIYALTYEAKDPAVTGAGLAGVRDLLAYVRDHAIAGSPPPRRTLIFGISQSGRLIGRMLHDRLDRDARGRLVFDAAFIQVPGGGGSAGFNARFAQPTRHPSNLEEHDYPSDAFPFTTAPSRDPVTGATASTLDHARNAEGRAPKLIYANTSTEFWNRDASLIATTPDGRADVAPAAGVRLYGLMGAQHYVGRSTVRAPYVNCVSTTDHYLPVRALILSLDRWAGGGAPPPASAYPSVAKGELVTPEAYRTAFPKITLTPPLHHLAEPRLGAGVPPELGAPYGTRVPAPDADGNDRGGVRMVELEVPLGTHTGWNPRDPATGFADYTARFDGSFLPFARTEAERAAAHDPRPSLDARYPTRSAFEAKVRAAAARSVAQGFLLEEDVPRSLKENLGLYDRLMAHDPGDSSCRYLTPG